MTTVLMDHNELVNKLLDLGADPLLPEPSFNDASAFFTSIGANYSNPDAFKTIISRYAKSLSPEISSYSSNDTGPLSHPLSLDYIKSLHNFGCIDIPTQCGPSSDILHQIIIYGFNSQSIIEFLLDKGAAINSRNTDGLTPLFYAVQLSKLGIIRELLKRGAALQYRGPNHSTPLHTAAALDDNGEVLNLLLEVSLNVNVKDDDGSTPLHKAAEAGNAGAVCALLSCGGDGSLKDASGMTPFDVAKIALIKAGSMPSVQRLRKTILLKDIIEMPEPFESRDRKRLDVVIVEI